jgi:hypothetical protein
LSQGVAERFTLVVELVQHHRDRDGIGRLGHVGSLLAGRSLGCKAD